MTYLLPITLASFSALEFILISRRSSREAYYAFLLPMIETSEPLLLARQLLEVETEESWKPMLLDAQIIQPDRRYDLEGLRGLEMSLKTAYVEEYNHILAYLPEDLRGFFDSARIAWDIENLKVILTAVSTKVPWEMLKAYLFPSIYLELSEMEALAKSKDIETLWEATREMLPREYTSLISLDLDLAEPFNILKARLDQAFCSYIATKSEEIRTQTTRDAYRSICELHELENIILTARLKYHEIPPEQISQLLCPCEGRLGNRILTSLVEAQNYEMFLRVLLDSVYGEELPGFTASQSPEKLEDELRRLVLIGFDRLIREIDLEAILRHVTSLETRFDVVRKAAFWALLRHEGGDS